MAREYKYNSVVDTFDRATYPVDGGVSAVNGGIGVTMSVHAVGSAEGPMPSVQFYTPEFVPLRWDDDNGPMRPAGANALVQLSQAILKMNQSAWRRHVKFVLKYEARGECALDRVSTSDLFAELQRRTTI